MVIIPATYVIGYGATVYADKTYPIPWPHKIKRVDIETLYGDIVGSYIEHTGAFTLGSDPGSCGIAVIPFNGQALIDCDVLRVVISTVNIIIHHRDGVTGGSLTYGMGNGFPGVAQAAIAGVVMSVGADIPGISCAGGHG